MSKEPQEDEKAVLAALDGIGPYAADHTGGLDLCVDTGLVFLRTYYNNLPGHVARRLTEFSPVALAAIPGVTGPNGSRKARKNIASHVAGDASLRAGHPGGQRLPGASGL